MVVAKAVVEAEWSLQVETVVVPTVFNLLCSHGVTQDSEDLKLAVVLVEVLGDQEMVDKQVL